MRYYWIASSESLQIRMLITISPYFYEYMGSGNEIVNTPMTDRAYISMLTAMYFGWCYNRKSLFDMKIEIFPLISL